MGKYVLGQSSAGECLFIGFANQLIPWSMRHAGFECLDDRRSIGSEARLHGWRNLERPKKKAPMMHGAILVADLDSVTVFGPVGAETFLRTLV
ncbi:MAG: hypothetical protein ABIO38_02340, partial [Luteimonas sp.]